MCVCGQTPFPSEIPPSKRPQFIWKGNSDMAVSILLETHHPPAHNFSPSVRPQTNHENTSETACGTMCAESGVPGTSRGLILSPNGLNFWVEKEPSRGGGLAPPPLPPDPSSFRQNALPAARPGQHPPGPPGRRGGLGRKGEGVRGAVKTLREGHVIHFRGFSYYSGFSILKAAPVELASTTSTMKN